MENKKDETNMGGEDRPEIEEKDSKLIQFFVLTFIISWLIWLPQVLSSQNIIEMPEWYGLVSNLATFGPLASALLLGRSMGESRYRIQWKVNSPGKWYIPILIVFPILAFLSLILTSVLTGDSYEIVVDPIFLVIMFLVGGPLGEEYGWRGFALPRLQYTYSAFRSSIYLGAIWSIWHLPLHFIQGTTQSYIPIWAFFLLNTTISIVYTWVYNNTNGSIFGVTVLHWSANAAAIIFPYWQIGLINGMDPNLVLPTFGMLIGYGFILGFVLLILKFWDPSTLKRKN